MKSDSKHIYKWIYAVTSFTVIIWFAISIFNFISIEQAVNEKEEYLSAQLSGLSSQGGSVHYGMIETFIDNKNEREHLGILLRDYQNTFLVKTVWSNRAGRKSGSVAETISDFDTKYHALAEQDETLKREHLAVTEIQREIDKLFNTLPSRINVNSGLSLIETSLTEINAMESRVKNLKDQLNQREPSNLQPEQLLILNQNFYSTYREILNEDLKTVTSLKEKLLLLSDKQKEQHQKLASFSSQFTQSTGSVQLLYEHLHPLTRNLGEYAEPVRSGIQTLDRNIMPGVTGLTLLRQIDPVSYQTVILVGEVADQIVALDSEIEDLVANIHSLRQRANSFLNTNSRESAVQLVDQASSSASYLDSKKTVFEPVYDRLETAGNQLNRLASSINRVRNATVRNMLSDINNRSINMISRMAQPITIYRENVDRSVRELNQIVESEKRYTNKVRAIRAAEFNSAELSPEPAVLMASQGFSFDRQWMPLFVIIGAGLLNVMIVFLLLRTPNTVKSGRRKKHSKVTQNRKTYKTERSINPLKDDSKIINKNSSHEDKIERPLDKPLKNIQELNAYKWDESDQTVENIPNTETSNKKSVSVNRDKSTPKNNDISRKHFVSDAPKKKADTNSVLKKETRSAIDDIQQNSAKIENKSKSVQDKSKLPELRNTYTLNFKILNGTEKGKILQNISLLHNGSLHIATIGRSSEKRSNHICVNDDGGHISRLHAELALINKKCYVRNLSDTNPLRLNQVEVSDSGYTPINENDVLTLGTLKLSAFRP